MSKKLSVAVLLGGPSLEHEISVITGYQIIEALDSTRFTPLPVYIDLEGRWWVGEALAKQPKVLPGPKMKERLTEVYLGPDRQLIPVAKKWWHRTSSYPIDVAIPALHGQYGEDGRLQGMLESFQMPYVGPGVFSGALAMDKLGAKHFARSLGIPVLPEYSVTRVMWHPMVYDTMVDKILEFSPFPLIVKPRHLGSSLGVSAARCKDELLFSVSGALVLDHEVLIEPLVEPLIEYNLAVLEGEPCRFSAIEQPLREGEVLSFEQKYMQGGGAKKTGNSQQGMALAFRKINPPDMPPEARRNIREWSKSYFEASHLSGGARFDYLFDCKKQQLYFNEVNPIPGSMAFFLWEFAEQPLNFTELLSYLVERAVDPQRRRLPMLPPLPARVFEREV